MTSVRRIAWTDIDRKAHRYLFSEYMAEVAQSRYVIRRVHMIIDACAAKFGLVPLEHQALIQIYGAPSHALPIGQIAERLNIVPALASRLVGRLDGAGFIKRTPLPRDRRTIIARTTAKGEDRLYRIADMAHQRVRAFYPQITESERNAAQDITAFYVGRATRSAKRKPSKRRAT